MKYIFGAIPVEQLKNKVHHNTVRLILHSKKNPPSLRERNCHEHKISSDGKQKQVHSQPTVRTKKKSIRVDSNLHIFLHFDKNVPKNRTEPKIFEVDV